MSELLLAIGGARACGYGVAHKGNTGCGIETPHMAIRHRAKDAHPDLQGAEVDTRWMSVLISKSSTSKKILDILLLGNKEAIRGRINLNSKEVTKRTNIRHKNYSLRRTFKKGNALRVVGSDDHVINI